MANLVSGWTDGDRSYLVERAGDEIRIRTVPARWSFFVTGLDDGDRAALARDRRVTGVREDGRYTRVDCRNRWARKELVEILERAARKTTGVEILEADVSPIVRLLADVPSLQVDPDPRLGFFDLETDSRASFAAMKAGEARILSWAFCGVDGEPIAAVLEADSDAAERELIRGFIEAASRFDVLLAWNGDGFDFPVIQTRATVLGIEAGGKPIPWNRWCWLDALEVFKKYNQHSDGGGEQKASYKLDHVATYLLGEGKNEFDATKTWEAWAAGGEERDRLLRYNVQDTCLLPRIEAATGFLGLHLAVCHICRVFADTHSLHATAQGDGFLLRLGADHGYRWATKPDFGDDPPRPFKGAFVMEPRKLGAIDNVHVCDFAGLYPSIMRTWNMSPDTKLGPGPDVDALADKAVTFSKTEPRLIPGVCQLPGRSTWFRTDHPGMFQIALDSLVAKRAEYTAEMKKHSAGTPEHERFKRLSGAFKIVANSFYGITGSPWSRFFDPEIAEGVTQTGRWLLENVIEEATKRGLDPFYGDTDSVFVAGAADSMRSLVAAMNESWRERLEPWGIRRDMPMHIDLDFEKTFRRIVIVSAKRYAGAYLVYKGKPALETAKPEVKGLEFKRGDTIRLARQMQSEVVHTLLRPGPIPPPAEIRTIVDRYRARVLHGELTLDDVRITQSLSKRVEEYVDRFNTERCRCGFLFDGTGPDGPDTCPSCNVPRAKTSQPAHVRVAQILRDRGEPLGEGSRVAYVIVGSAKTLEAIPADDPGALERADRSYYWERRIYPATERILEHVYPQVRSWGESKFDRKQRVQELNGQARLDFTAEPVALPDGRVRRKKVTATPSVTPGRIRRRKRQTEPEGIVFTIMEATNLEDGGAEAIRRRRLVEAVKAAIEAHPGDTPVTIRVVWKSVLANEDPLRVQVKVEIPTGLGMSRTLEARQALERLAVRPEHVTGFPG